MSTFQHLAHAGPSPLGTLRILPKELRNLVYLDFANRPDEASIHDVCTTAMELQVVNKTLHKEVLQREAKTIPYICKHTAYLIRLPSFAELPATQPPNTMMSYLINRDIAVNKRRHDIAHAKSLRFVVLVGSNVPLAAMVYPRLCGGSTVAVHGAISERTKKVVTEMLRVLLALETRARTHSFNSMGYLVANVNGPHTELDIRDISNIAERLRNVAVQDIGQGFISWV